MLQHEMKNCIQLPRAEAIAQLNDILRRTGKGGVVMVTQSVVNLPGFDLATLAAALAGYDAFDPDNDPHGERDFGDLTLWGTDLLWKIDYYDGDLHFGSDDPANSSFTRRVLTVMIAADW